MVNSEKQGMYLVLISVHGLVRGHNLELGRDADTGGQIKYVVELARALAEHPGVERVDLLTRQVTDPKVDSDYAQPLEPLGHNAFIVRIPCGPRRYLRKEVLWPHLDSFADQALHHIRRVGRAPDILHTHYADAGYVGTRLAGLLGVPLVHTGHSLGRVKRKRLLDNGLKEAQIESQYNMAQRIEAEEMTLDSAALVIASTRQEVEQQYVLYDNYQPGAMNVIPPGTDLKHFAPPGRIRHETPIQRQINRFLRDPRKPIILALSRADGRKNIATLVRAYGENPALRAAANLVIVAGNRDDIQTMDKEAREVLSGILLLVDKYDLYGQAALPKHHDAGDVPDIYRLATRTRGVFVNPALTEPFGLTLIEAAASGLPIVATEDGGPHDIIAHCKNGLLIDPLDADGMSEALLKALSNAKQWRQWSRNGLKGVHRHYSWISHVQKYLRAAQRLIGKPGRRRILRAPRSRLPTADRILVCDVDNTLTGDREALDQLLGRLQDSPARVGFGIVTGRGVTGTVKVLKAWQVPVPDLLITSVGTEIYYGPQIIRDEGWRHHIDYRWKPDAVREAMEDIPGLSLQPESEQSGFKISYFVDTDEAPSVRDISRHLRKLDLSVNVVFSHDAFLDLLPVRASKGAALRYFAMKWGVPVDRMLAAGDSGSDEKMLSGDTLAIVVGNHGPELEKLRGRDRIYFAAGHHAWGILEGIDHYDFLGEIKVDPGTGAAA